jgi:7,8-dihydropterin-6-yl-methyl-4-(beta-D-ribofuranosyl)aminobenzene 5'-phosphate synthase
VAFPSLALDELSLVILVDNETDTLSSVDDGIPQTPEAIGLAARLPADGAGGGKVVFDRLCCAGHGFSVLVTGRRGGEEHSVLFDAGPYPSLWRDNAERLGIDLARIETVFLSHWHSDHSGALPAAVQAIAAARQDGVAVDLHPDRPDQRGVVLPSGTTLLLPPEPAFEAIEEAGGRVARHAEPHTLAHGFFFASGQIPRLTSYETGLAGHHSRRGDRFEADPLILDERFLAAHVRGRGVTVLSACSHAGIVNACLEARAQDPDLPVDVVIGGYHLAGKAMEPRIAPTVDDLERRIGPRVVAPGHCTGWRAKAALAARFAPGRYAPSVVGSRYTLRSPGP